MGANVFTLGRSLESLKAGFFDRQLVIDKVERAKRRVLERQGAFIRARSQSMQLRHPVPKKFGHKSRVVDRAGVSPPGEPPYPHTGLLVTWILFAYDRATGGVVIGPMKTNQVFFNQAGRPATGTVPQVLEYGGRVTVLEWWLSHLGIWQRADLRFKRKLAERPTRYRTVTVAARPFMHPAERAERGRFAPQFRDSVR